MVADTRIVTTKMVKTQRTVFFRSFLDDSDFANLNALLYTVNSLEIDNKNGDRQDKSYGLGRVGFPQTEPAVTAQAVSI